MSESGRRPAGQRRRDPARWWYLAATAAVAVILALEFSGTLDAFGP